jgi:hypothetical protein
LIFSHTLPLGLLEYFVFKEVYGRKGLPLWGRGLTEDIFTLVVQKGNYNKYAPLRLQWLYQDEYWKN